MYSKENEYVPFKEWFVCNGAVEVYLSALEAKMQSALAEILVDARDTADEWNTGESEKSRRHNWLEGYCA